MSRACAKCVTSSSPGGILFVEDGDLASAGSIPPSSQDAFADLFSRLGPLRGVDYSLANNLYHLVKRVGFSYPKLEIHQPALLEGEDRYLSTKDGSLLKSIKRARLRWRL